jgi:hypothetical protein
MRFCWREKEVNRRKQAFVPEHSQVTWGVRWIPNIWSIQALYLTPKQFARVSLFLRAFLPWPAVLGRFLCSKASSQLVSSQKYSTEHTQFMHDNNIFDSYVTVANHGSFSNRGEDHGFLAQNALLLAWLYGYYNHTHTRHLTPEQSARVPPNTHLPEPNFS